VFPPLFALLDASSAVRAIFGSAPVRVYPFGVAPAKGQPGHLVPYATFQTIFGTPENYMGDVPDMDAWGVQVDVYADSLSGARAGAEAIRDAVEPTAYVTAWNGDFWDEVTKLHRYSMTVSFLTPR
jgi:hypothetical protein